MQLSQIQELFAHQLILANQFSLIEQSNLSNLSHSIPANLDTCEGQAVIRLFTTYFAEEVWEAHAVEGEPSLEELCDALHFLVEICLRTGVTETSICANQYMITSDNHGVYLGKLLHSLRLRPWKQKKQPADLFAIRTSVISLFAAFLDHVSACGFTEERLLNGYFKKAEVNQQRIAAGV
jgi:dimeric dUTPase (all-alpha-NTP-PPase superfamily)